MDKGSEVIKIVEWNFKGQGTCFIFRTAERTFPTAEYTFHTAVCTFRSGECTFRSDERTFRSAEHRLDACSNKIIITIVRTL